MFCAFRYALCGTTLACGAICNVIIYNWDNFDKGSKMLFHREITSYKEKITDGTTVYDQDKRFFKDHWQKILNLPIN